MDAPVKVACVQAEPVILDRDATVRKLAQLTAEAAEQGASLVVFPEAFIPVYPSSTWAKALAGWGDGRAKEAFAQMAEQSVAVGGEAELRIAEAAGENGVWIVTGVTEIDPERPGTLYNTLLYHDPGGRLAFSHRKLVPTNHERLVWGPGDGSGLRAVPTELGRIGGLICWENYMPLARFALYESGVEIYIASTADDADEWQSTLVHLARESRAFVVAPSHFQRAGVLSGRFSASGRARRPRHARPWRKRGARSGWVVSGRAAVRRGRDSLRRPRPGGPASGAPALRSGGPLPPARRAPSEGSSARLAHFRHEGVTDA